MVGRWVWVLHTVWLLAAAWLTAAVAVGQHQGASTLSLYVDDDHTQVVTSVTRAKAEPWTGGTLTASYLIDVISSASVDVVSQATPRFEENRHALNAGVSQAIGLHTLRASYGYSIEIGTGERPGHKGARIADYQGHGLGAGADLVFFDRNTTVSADYAIELGQVGWANDANFKEALTTHVVDLRVAQVLSRRLLGELGWTFTGQGGYTAKPYRFARVQEVLPGVCRVCPPETHPRTRLRNAVFGGLRRHLFAESALSLRYRFYFDDWGLTAHTVEGRLHLGWSKAFGIRLRYRLHLQGAANFWQDVYSQPRRYMTADRELSPLSGNLLGLLIFRRFGRFGPASAVELYGKVDGFRYDYDDYRRLTSRSGLVVETGLEVSF